MVLDADLDFRTGGTSRLLVNSMTHKKIKIERKEMTNVYWVKIIQVTLQLLVALE